MLASPDFALQQTRPFQHPSLSKSGPTIAIIMEHSQPKIARPIRRASSSAPIPTAFGERTLSETLILVEDEHGNPAGIATLEDALEFIFSIEIESEEEQSTNL